MSPNEPSDAPTTTHQAPADETQQARDKRLQSYQAGLPEEALHVACIMNGDRHGSRFYGHHERIELQDAQGTLEALLEAFDTDAPLQVRAHGSPGLNPFAAGVIEAEVDGTPVTLGHIGRLLPSFAKNYQVPEDTFVWEVSLQQLARLPARNSRVCALPKFPATRRDVAILAPATLPHETLRQFIAQHAGGALGAEVIERVWLFDRYLGKPIAQDHVSLAFAISYRKPTGTLTDDAVNEAFEALLTELPQKFEVTIRR